MQRITDHQKYENLNMAKNKIIFSQIRDFQSTNIIAKIRGYFFRLRLMKKIGVWLLARLNAVIRFFKRVIQYSPGII